jgi:hypothetical protein
VETPGESGAISTLLEAREGAPGSGESSRASDEWFLGACCDSSEGPADEVVGGLLFLSPIGGGDMSSDTLDNPLVAASVEPDLSFSLWGTDLLVARSLSILLITKDNLSSAVVELNEDDGDGDGSGREPMRMDSGRGVWLPPLPFEGGTPTKRVGGAGLAAAEACSISIRVSTSSIAISTFSGLRSRRGVDEDSGR